MSINLPEEVVWVFNMLGLPWPDIDEDQLREHASHLREYAGSLADTHESAFADIKSLSASYAGPSYDVLAERWAHFSSTHINEIVEVCRGFATALEVAADAVVTAKGAVIAALVAMAAEVVADQGAAVVTFGASEALIPGIVAATRAIVKAALDQLEQQLISMALEAAIGPLEDKIQNAIENMVLQGVEAALA
jgi:hypothetical protein